ncbi:hypothetical protein GCK72_022430 [Caenorhabditis remanei]|uniref:Uncharacterized protein n=1 Tax=Caenorhabditis remanei TaxID=31234 RepID=A0A6A5FTQ9_CAERE|nr:hypothetical protein GCK72_022430 [Caenorhabditis remanei]KAF1745980.1 hypothetical protein GCK72_022430 [Caenorhabditis remanei]
MKIPVQKRPSFLEHVNVIANHKHLNTWYILVMVIKLTWYAETETNTLTYIIRELSEIVRVIDIKFYLLDRRDVLRIQKNILGACPGEREKNDAMLIYMRNLTDFSKNCQKVIYLRTMAPAAGETARRVFKEEAQEIILIILTKQKPDEGKRKLEERLNKYRGGSKSHKYIHQTMDLNEFIAILEEHKVPKDQKHGTTAFYRNQRKFRRHFSRAFRTMNDYENYLDTRATATFTVV